MKRTSKKCGEKSQKAVLMGSRKGSVVLYPKWFRGLFKKHDKPVHQEPVKAGADQLSRREILEELLRQGMHGISRIKSECRRFEDYWETRIGESNCRGRTQKKRSQKS